MDRTANTPISETMAPNPFETMRWEHLAGFGIVLGVLGAMWRWLAKHIKDLKVRINGYTIEKKAEKTGKLG